MAMGPMMQSLIATAVMGNVAAHGRPVTLCRPAMSVWVELMHSSKKRRGGEARNARRGDCGVLPVLNNDGR